MQKAEEELSRLQGTIFVNSNTISRYLVTYIYIHNIESSAAKESRIYASAIIKMRLLSGYMHITMEPVSTPTEPQCYLTNIP